MKKSMFLLAIVAVSLFLSSCTQQPVQQSLQPVQNPTILYTAGDPVTITPEHHSSIIVNGVNCAGKPIQYKKLVDNGQGCPVTYTPVGQQVVFANQPVQSNFWGNPDWNSIWPWVAIIGLILFGIWLWNNWNGRDHNHNHQHNHTWQNNSGPQARSDYQNKPGCHQDNDNARSWFNGAIPDSHPNVKSEKFTFEREYFDRQTNGASSGSAEQPSRH